MGVSMIGSAPLGRINGERKASAVCHGLQLIHVKVGAQNESGPARSMPPSMRPRVRESGDVDHTQAARRARTRRSPKEESALCGSWWRCQIEAIRHTIPAGPEERCTVNPHDSSVAIARAGSIRSLR